MKAGISARRCSGCGKGYGVFAMSGAYWHHRCFTKATPEERNEARKQQAALMGKEVPNGSR